MVPVFKSDSPHPHLVLALLMPILKYSQRYPHLYLIKTSLPASWNNAAVPFHVLGRGG